MKCTLCGTENPDNANFCGICGNPIADSANVPGSNTSVSAEPHASAAHDPNANSNVSPEPCERVNSAPAEASSQDLDINVNTDAEARCISESVSEAAPEAPNESNANLHLAELPIPGPTVPNSQKKAIFSNSGLGSSFDSSAKPPVPKKEKAGKHELEKEKKTVSLSVAIICIISVFILAVVCGILTQLYMRKGGASNRTETVPSSYKASEIKSERLECFYIH